MVGEAEIVVGAKAEDRTAADLDFGSLGAGNAEGPTEQAGGFELG
jgi:hypothetical protein